jgi:hypothetical protein
MDVNKIYVSFRRMDFGPDPYDSSNISSGYIRAGEIFDHLAGDWIIEKV